MNLTLLTMSSVRRSLLFVGLPVLLVLGALVWWVSRTTAAPVPASAGADAPVRVHTALVQARNVPMRLQGLGAVQAWETVTVRSRIDGQLEKVGFKEGDTVRRGQLIAQLDDRAQQAQLAQALAQKAHDQALLDNARRDLKRYTELARQSAIDRQTLDTQRAQVATLQATLQADDAQVQAARVQLDYTRILSPLTGRTGARLVDPGNLVKASDTQGLVVINQLDPVAVSFTVPDTAYAQVRAALRRTAGQGPDVTGAQPPVVAARPDATAPQPPATAASPDVTVRGPIRVEVFEQGKNRLLGQGELVLVDNQIDASSATLRLKARLDNAGHVLWPGQTVDVRLILGDHENALVVPDSAVQRSASGLFVYVVGADDSVRAQPVRVLVSQDGHSLVAQGLTQGERVVTDGQYKLKPGARVAEIEDAAPAAAPRPAAS
ncbi:efflux RND transporter periplasmic adaptor subunit [Castellaniella caeni]|uniref:efflux RND transporter periplasmic adaptor subunit n=1 Tax=Castellaniella caeni TaxID=266123 RepID=UPI001E48A0D8|nr:efflux RND transporter periplasmic adaptor subunit [Castellaniella caeni]